MICIECRNDNCSYCRNHVNVAGILRDPPTKTWCDCQHKTGVILTPKDCHHYRMTDNICPTCGSDFNEPGNPEEEPTSETIANVQGIGNETANVEPEDDEEGITFRRDKGPDFTVEKLEAKRGSVSRRSKKASSS